MPRKTYFSDLCLKFPQYNDWLRKKDDITGQCSYCAKDFDVPNMGKLALQSHAGSKEHQSRSPTESNNSLSFFDRGKKEKNKEMSANSEKDKRQNKPTSSGQKTIDNTFTRDNFLFAEIRFALKTFEYNCSQCSCENINELFKVMFPGSIVAEHFKVGRTKCGCLITHGFRNYFLDILYTEIQQSPFYYVSFGESLNKNLQKVQMDQLVRIWSNEKKMVATQYFNSEFMGGAKAEKILQTFEKGINKLNPESFIQIYSGGPKVSLCFLELFAEKRESEKLLPLIQIGTCDLHTIHGSMKAGVEISN